MAFIKRMRNKCSISLFIKTAIALSFLLSLIFTYYAYVQDVSTISENQVIKRQDFIGIFENKNFSAKLNAIEEEIRNYKQGIHNRRQNNVSLSSNNMTNQNEIKSDEEGTSELNTNVHIFYYPWYKSEIYDGRYAHWNHRILPHWSNKMPNTLAPHKPPDDIGSNFYPSLGPYSSSDPKILDTHMKQIKSTGAGVVVVSWYPPNLELENEEPVDSLMMKILDAAIKYSLKVTFHIEPFKNRNSEHVFNVIKFIIDTYGAHEAFYRSLSKGKLLPMYYFYDSYQISTHEWNAAFSRQRNTKYDGIFLGLLARQEHMNHLAASGFDGFYTYFAVDGFEYGSTWQNWPIISRDAKKLNLIFVPSIGPGYVDTRIRPWNDKNTRKRSNGQYYRASFLAALATKPEFLSITSFNEWHEGTQIEPAIPKTFGNYKYEDYQPRSPDFYLKLTKFFVKEFSGDLKLTWWG